MQSWFFLEDQNNVLMRYAGDISQNVETLDEISEVQTTRDWLFQVRASNLKPEEVVCLIGDIPELGSWIPEKCKVLAKSDGDLWSIHMKIPSNTIVRYRYFIGVIVETNKQVIVRSWETNMRARKIKPDQLQEENLEVDNLGTYNGLTRVDKGWLINGTIIQLMLCKEPFKLWRPRFENRKLHIKVTPVSLIKPNQIATKPDTMDESLSNDRPDDYPQYSYTDVANLKSKDASFKTQGQFGHKFRVGDVIIFQSYILNPATTALLIDIYVYSSKAIDDEPPYHAGFCYILPSVFQSSTGNIILPLTSTKQRPLGELRLEYLVINPLPNFKCDMRLSFARYWKKTKHGLNIGHRGSGSSFKKEEQESATIRENTIASLKTAVNHGADYVEFDVQLSKDFVPVIYHDYHVCIAMSKKKNLAEIDMYQIPIKDLTLDQLRMLKVSG